MIFGPCRITRRQGRALFCGRCVGAMVTLFILAASVSVGVAGPDAPRGERAPHDLEFANAETAQLDLLAGLWKVTQSHLDAGGNEIASAQGTEEVSWILNRHAIHRVYSSGDKPNVFHANGTLSWNDVAKVYQGAWFDNVSTAGPTRVEGTWNQKEQAFQFSLKVSGPDGSTRNYRVTERIVDDETRETTTHLVNEDGTTVKLIESKYVRSIRCPSKIRPVFDELQNDRGE